MDVDEVEDASAADSEDEADAVSVDDGISGMDDREMGSESGPVKRERSNVDFERRAREQQAQDEDDNRMDTLQAPLDLVVSSPQNGDTSSTNG